ncbi:unnamed protein product [Clonostachys chloroleuca]|uniref:NmrA-like domain-containing protein n=1 Tax=Clonostachys chloroleuca TaxID=1926264 RepID=A0AA35LRV7_9HYPO|nr:unnamed protein product [Clonostachys chloroleuca]
MTSSVGKPSAIAVAGSGDIARYLAEEFVRHSQYEFHLISRKEPSWASQLKIQHHAIRDFNKDKLAEIFNEHGIKAIISTLSTDDASVFIPLHEAILDACRISATCKRLIPSDFVGDVEKWPHLPRSYRNTRFTFRKILEDQTEVEWTSVNQGWLMDYFVHFPEGAKTYIKPYASWPLSLKDATCRLPGNGDDKLTWTAAHDVAKAVVALMAQPKWDRYTYVYGEVGTWREVLPKVENALGIKIERLPFPVEKIEKAVEDFSDPEKQYMASIDEWTVRGAGLVPLDVARKQRENLFSSIKFRTIEELLHEAQTVDIV